MMQGAIHYCRSPRTVGADVAGEVTLLDTAGGMYFGLEGPGARVWALLEVPRTVDALVGILLEEYEVEAKLCRRETIELLDALAAKHLIEVVAG